MLKIVSKVKCILLKLPRPTWDLLPIVYVINAVLSNYSTLLVATHRTRTHHHSPRSSPNANPMAAYGFPAFGFSGFGQSPMGMFQRDDDFFGGMMGGGMMGGGMMGSMG